METIITTSSLNSYPPVSVWKESAIRNVLKKLKNRISQFFTSFTQSSSSSSYQAYAVDNGNNATTPSFHKRNIKRFFKRSKYLPFILVLLVLLVVGYLVVSTISNQSAPTVLGNDDKVEVKKPISTQSLHRTFAYPIKNAKGVEVSKIRYNLDSAELRDEIIWNGKRGQTIKGRTFLILNLRLTNDYNQPIQLNARDYVRLVIDGSQERMAPDLNSDPIEIQAISTKPTRLGFPINDEFKSLILQVGEIDGAKEQVKLTLQSR